MECKIFILEPNWLEFYDFLLIATVLVRLKF